MQVDRSIAPLEELHRVDVFHEMMKVCSQLQFETPRVCGHFDAFLKLLDLSIVFCSYISLQIDMIFQQ